MYTLIQSAKLNDVDPHPWLADVLARIADSPPTRLADLLSWNWGPATAPATKPPDRGLRWTVTMFLNCSSLLLISHPEVVLDGGRKLTHREFPACGRLGYPRQ